MVNVPLKKLKDIFHRIFYRVEHVDYKNVYQLKLMKKIRHDQGQRVVHH